MTGRCDLHAGRSASEDVSDAQRAAQVRGRVLGKPSPSTQSHVGTVDKRLFFSPHAPNQVKEVAGLYVCEFVAAVSELRLNVQTGCRLLVVYNPTEQRRATVVSVAVDCPDARVVDAESGRPMAAQISAVWEEPNRPSAEKFQVKNCRL